MKLINGVTEIYLPKIEQLYEEAFPQEEKKPFSMILGREKEKSVEVLAAISDEDNQTQFIGEAITAKYEDIVLLDYFAMASECRGKGKGSKTLRALQKRYEKQRFFLEIERTGVPAPNAKDRERRKKFYLSNGMKQMDYYVEVRGVEMEVLTYNCEITYEEYRAVYRNVYGKEIEDTIKKI